MKGCKAIVGEVTVSGCYMESTPADKCIGAAWYMILKARTIAPSSFTSQQRGILVRFLQRSGA